MGSFGSFCVIHGFQEAPLQPGRNIGSKCGQVLDFILCKRIVPENTKLYNM